MPTFGNSAARVRRKQRQAGASQRGVAELLEAIRGDVREHAQDDGFPDVERMTKFAHMLFTISCSEMEMSLAAQACDEHPGPDIYRRRSNWRHAGRTAWVRQDGGGRK
jgi:hypothetical protein